MIEQADYQLGWQDLNLAVIMPIALGLFEQNVGLKPKDVADSELRLIDQVNRLSRRHAARQTVTGEPIGIRALNYRVKWLLPGIILVLRERGVHVEEDLGGDNELAVSSKRAVGKVLF